MNIQTPTGFSVEKVDEIPADVLYARQVTKWTWLRKLVIKAEDGEVIRVTCPSKHESVLAYGSMRNEHTYRHIKGYQITCRTAPVDAQDGPWYIYIQKKRK